MQPSDFGKVLLVLEEARAGGGGGGACADGPDGRDAWGMTGALQCAGPRQHDMGICDYMLSVNAYHVFFLENGMGRLAWSEALNVVMMLWCSDMVGDML